MPTTIQQLLIRLREERGWSQGDLADQMDAVGYPTTRGAISHFEVGRRALSVRMSVAYRAVLGLDGEELDQFSRLVDDQFPPLENSEEAAA